MKSARPGNSISPVEVTNLSPQGHWMRLDDEESFLPFPEFWCFQGAGVDAAFRVELPLAGHLSWPDLDTDLAVESIQYPQRFPLVSRVASIHGDRPTKVSINDPGLAP